jgi:hypothetical protein
LAELAIRRDVEAAGERMRRAESGPALALKAYREKPNDQRVEWLTKAVLRAQGLDTALARYCSRSEGCSRRSDEPRARLRLRGVPVSSKPGAAELAAMNRHV